MRFVDQDEQQGFAASFDPKSVQIAPRKNVEDDELDFLSATIFFSV
jgi:hypothetical protein